MLAKHSPHTESMTLAPLRARVANPGLCEFTTTFGSIHCGDIMVSYRQHGWAPLRASEVGRLLKDEVTNVSTQ